ncbi:response regulator transcription factor [Ruminococcus sp.]|uniref:response regulator transcription factor n=1 Tax=Ruminococcus sp. TaxID=41978 RepID=UPI002CAEF634|nr:response regulator transcription factor [Ruminococcus sp.]HNZ98476.1 response regulator transcription factor [Ruminococcus sp.]HOH85709.1 response regulator transcription factor [Ruminococcus sp.]
MDKKRILIVDDDSDLSFIISEMLEGCGYETKCADSAETVFSLLSERSFHLILLDINLPDSTGFEICRQLREVSDVPVIFASARTAENDRITGFDIGGDDFLPKPYSMKELLSRVNALIRRAYGQGSGKVMRFGSVEVNTANRTVTKNGSNIDLAQREFDLLAYLCRNMNTAVPKEKLLSEVWGAFSEVEPSTLTVHIRWLREKLEDDPAAPRYIKTIWRLGYMLEGDK